MREEYKTSVENFLQIKKVAIAGYSTNTAQPANHIYKRLRDNGYTVFAVNPKNDLIADVKCFSSLDAIPELIDGVVICTPSIVTPSVVRDCLRLNIKHVWMHRAFDEGSFSKHAFELCRENGINCVTTGCPMMFIRPDLPHKCVKWILDIGGKLKN